MPCVSYLRSDPTQKGNWQSATNDHNAIINLAGASIFRRWTEETKRAIGESRILTTRNLVEGLDPERAKSMTLFSTSAILAIMGSTEMKSWWRILNR
jgi:NAD dependent epimerase/dehydratase family enzyme